MTNENTAPAGELTDRQVGACLDETNLNSQYAKHQFGWHCDFARAIITADRALRASPAEGDDDATESVNATNTALATQYFEVIKKLEAYEKQGVTCQTFRHFVDVPCAECNAVVGPAVGDVAMPVIGWYGTNHAGCAAISQKESRVLRMFDLAQPLVKQSDAQAALV